MYKFHLVGRYKTLLEFSNQYLVIMFCIWQKSIEDVTFDEDPDLIFSFQN